MVSYLPDDAADTGLVAMAVAWVKRTRLPPLAIGPLIQCTASTMRSIHVLLGSPFSMYLRRVSLAIFVAFTDGASRPTSVASN